jgi:hypothetical protein
MALPGAAISAAPSTAAASTSLLMVAAGYITALSMRAGHLFA